ncbi:hypothetical protein [Streptomyces sp. SP18CS02]|nr:hypothetical protein [Streptomyces sp. SP18CS02]MEE1753105.1 hypothetical protein [Streptomyces sp. SP18CS02]
MPLAAKTLARLALGGGACVACTAGTPATRRPLLLLTLDGRIR